MGRDDDLRALPVREIGPENAILLRLAVARGRRAQRRAGVIGPDSSGVDAMPVRAFPRFQEIENRGARRALSLMRLGPPGLAEPAAFGMGAEPQALDDLVSGQERLERSGTATAWKPASTCSTSPAQE